MFPHTHWFAFPADKLVRDVSHKDTFTMNSMNVLEKQTIVHIMKSTGAHIIKFPPQPQRDRPTHFYHIMGSYSSVSNATILLQTAISEYQQGLIVDFESAIDIDRACRLHSDSFRLSKKIPLWKAIGLVHSSTNHDIITFLNALCVINTKIDQIGCYNEGFVGCRCESSGRRHEQVQGQKDYIDIHIVGTEKTKIAESRNIIISHIFDTLDVRGEEWHRSCEDYVHGPIQHRDDPDVDFDTYLWGTYQNSKPKKECVAITYDDTPTLHD